MVAVWVGLIGLLAGCSQESRLEGHVYDVWGNPVKIPFVDGMTQCDVDSRDGNVITRTITFRGTQHREKITLVAPVKVQFERLDGTGWIDNVISDTDDGMLLTFTFGMTFPGIAEDTPEEQTQGNNMRGAYIGAVAATLNRVRQMVRDGELA